MVDHLFLTKDIVRIQATTDVKNVDHKRRCEPKPQHFLQSFPFYENLGSVHFADIFESNLN